MWRILQISEGVIQLRLRPRWITPFSICRILHILLSLIQWLLIESALEYVHFWSKNFFCVCCIKWTIFLLIADQYKMITTDVITYYRTIRRWEAGSYRIPCFWREMFYKKENSLSSLDSQRFSSAFLTISSNDLPFSYCISIVFNFFPDGCSTQGKLETMVM